MPSLLLQSMVRSLARAALVALLVQACVACSGRPGSQVNGQGVGGSGPVLGAAEAARLVLVDALTQIHQGGATGTLCEKIGLNPDQATFCRNLIVDHIADALALHTTHPVAFALSKTSLPSGFIAMTDLGPDGPITLDEARILDLLDKESQAPPTAQSNVVMQLAEVIAHETFHKIRILSALFPGGFITDQVSFPPFASAGGGRVLLDKIGKAIRVYLDQHRTYPDVVLADKPLGYWRLGERGGSVAIDASPNRNDGTYHNVTLGGLGAIANDTDTSVLFTNDGVDRNVAITLDDINVAPRTWVSVEFWMQWNGKEFAIPISFGSANLFFKDGGFGFNCGNADVLGTAVLAPLRDRWVHVVAEFQNGNLTQSKLYLNAREQSLVQVTGTTVANVSVRKTFQISGLAIPGSSSYYVFNGAIDEVSVYNAQLSEAQVSQHYSYGIQRY